MSTWHGVKEPSAFRPKGLDWLRICARALPIILMILMGVVLMALLRLAERPIFGLRRPWTPFITQIVSRGAFFFMGIPFSTEGTPMRQKGAVVSNHASWLDIFSLNARKRVYFVSKSEVASWPGIGFLAKITGTVFINRDRREAAKQIEIFRERLSAGNKLLFFPEGTSSDARRILPFKSTLFQAFFDESLKAFMWVQPVTVRYHPPKGADPRFYGWWGDMEFGAHLMQTLATAKQGRVEVIYHAPVKVSEFKDRKALAAYCESVVRQGLGTLDIDAS